MGPSIPPFYNMYRDRCVEFDEIYAWEAKQKVAQEWWDPIPFSMRRKIRFFNTPVEELWSVEANVLGQREPPHGSFLRMLQNTAAPEDFVVVKLDIDDGPEMEIIWAIAARPELSALIDELFFEFHFDEERVPGEFINHEWVNAKVRGTNVDTAIGLMAHLRKLGIRAHFWI